MIQPVLSEKDMPTCRKVEAWEFVEVSDGQSFYRKLETEQVDIGRFFNRENLTNIAMGSVFILTCFVNFNQVCWADLTRGRIVKKIPGSQHPSSKSSPRVRKPQTIEKMPERTQEMGPLFAILFILIPLIFSKGKEQTDIVPLQVKNFELRSVFFLSLSGVLESIILIGLLKEGIKSVKKTIFDIRSGNVAEDIVLTTAVQMVNTTLSIAATTFPLVNVIRIVAKEEPLLATVFPNVARVYKLIKYINILLTVRGIMLCSSGKRISHEHIGYLIANLVAEVALDMSLSEAQINLYGLGQGQKRGKTFGGLMLDKLWPMGKRRVNIPLLLPPSIKSKPFFPPKK